ncbi:MAG: exo-alpha-sialidase, partial [Candidatus Hydrogenedentes bacterium]|nr:exo-alpha-sialidase [Candidatus Hydrogenedentota bacterium]
MRIVLWKYRNLVSAMLFASVARAADPWNGVPMNATNLGELGLRVSEPVVVALSAVGEKRWGYHQFPAIFRLPDGRVLLTFNNCPDREDAYGKPGPAYVSSDEGVTWAAWTPPDAMLSIADSAISDVGHGEYLCVPMSRPLDLVQEKVALPAPVATMDVYGEVLLHRLDQCSDQVQAFMRAIPATRWIPDQKQWRRETMAWDMEQAFIRTRQAEQVIARPYIDKAILAVDGVLYYPGYHVPYVLPDGTTPRNFACWCMTSEDQGHTWRRQGLIAADASGDLMMGEPCMVPTTSGNLACVIRCADQNQKPMRITYSADKGRTWSAPTPLYDFGVMPQALLLSNGVTVLSFGRPGVRLMFSPDGSAKHWTAPLSLIAGDATNIYAHSCGYTRLLPAGNDSFLIAYSDFAYPAKDGGLCKAILIRKVQVSRNEGAAPLPPAIQLEDRR